MENHRELIIKALSQCVAACEFCATSCLDEPSVKDLTKCIRLDRDCADICSLAIKFLSRNSERATSIVELCVVLCAACAEECERHGHDHCIECAEACRHCEQSCRDYLNRQTKVKPM